ncbi:MAG: hypothetical protein JSW17_02155 [Candidatus Omnitrophota bacterium]|nr:MAG: hypothetical protein JSW17_02155 [Candidatus Omnitrophota bacterium]
MKKKELKLVDAKKVKIFKIQNRRGYAAVCFNNLTEGSTPSQAYDRMAKALRRGGVRIKRNRCSKN